MSEIEITPADALIAEAEARGVAPAEVRVEDLPTPAPASALNHEVNAPFVAPLVSSLGPTLEDKELSNAVQERIHLGNEIKLSLKSFFEIQQDFDSCVKRLLLGEDPFRIKEEFKTFFK